MTNIPSENYVSQIRKKIGNDLLILVGSNVIIENDCNQVLLQKRTTGSWGLPGGLLEVGETLEQTAIREVFEETGLKIEKLQLIYTFSGEDYHFILQNRDEIYVITSLYKAINYSGELIVNSEETLELRYFNYDCLPQNVEQEYLDYINYYRELK
ncbi:MULTISPECIES: NUDIX hydrolase [Streptococcus]|uniref:NUDIX hydrolase n=1 Tax=Streptococcus TaxID=1301 RepID=UPI00065FFFDA|nr:MULTISPECIES: NUDIX domain-containing protein [Streptococcus]MDN5012988.1 NUDIX domain-containing protein [Streptococcus sp. SN3]